MLSTADAHVQWALSLALSTFEILYVRHIDISTRKWFLTLPAFFSQKMLDVVGVCDETILFYARMLQINHALFHFDGTCSRCSSSEYCESTDYVHKYHHLEHAYHSPVGFIPWPCIPFHKFNQLATNRQHLHSPFRTKRCSYVYWSLIKGYMDVNCNWRKSVTIFCTQFVSVPWEQLTFRWHRFQWVGHDYRVRVARTRLFCVRFIYIRNFGEISLFISLKFVITNTLRIDKFTLFRIVMKIRCTKSMHAIDCEFQLSKLGNSRDFANTNTHTHTTHTLTEIEFFFQALHSNACKNITRIEFLSI